MPFKTFHVTIQLAQKSLQRPRADPLEPRLANAQGLRPFTFAKNNSADALSPRHGGKTHRQLKRFYGAFFKKRPATAQAESLLFHGQNYVSLDPSRNPICLTNTRLKRYNEPLNTVPIKAILYNLSWADPTHQSPSAKSKKPYRPRRKTLLTTSTRRNPHENLHHPYRTHQRGEKDHPK